jgi:hypothetical protein
MGPAVPFVPRLCRSLNATGVSASLAPSSTASASRCEALSAYRRQLASSTACPNCPEPTLRTALSADGTRGQMFIKRYTRATPRPRGRTSNSHSPSVASSAQ